MKAVSAVVVEPKRKRPDFREKVAASWRTLAVRLFRAPDAAVCAVVAENVAVTRTWCRRLREGMCEKSSVLVARRRLSSGGRTGDLFS